MKSKNKVLIIILVCLLIISCIFVGFLTSFESDSGKEKNKDSLLLECNSDNAKIGSEVVCNLKGNITEYDVSSVSVKIEKSSYFDLKSVDVDSSWQGDGEEGYITVYTDENKGGLFDIASFTVSLVNDDIDNFDINLIEIELSDENYDDHKLENVSKTFNVER